ncbi:acetyl esterase/lipase [Neisseria perflava]|uniref:alpha/beta hydrolase n=1 Tax=Neisseria perflava TaxID=33053 RepID=UPI0020A1BB66|nr:alpha/beta hydrolase [Neisseria perflava]MCP1772941.1 acetyl esterase/lipase [Neisseria perflava]
MQIKAFPGYEDHLYSYLSDGSATTAAHKAAQSKALLDFTLPPGMSMTDTLIAGAEVGQTLKLRIFKPAGLPESAPFILDIHGGGFVAGSLDIDNARCIALAERVPAIVVAVEYRLAGKDGVHFPAPLEDCHTAYRYLQAHGHEWGGDGKRIGIHGSSAGGNLAGGLALYLRDRGEQQPALTVMNCPTVDTAIAESMSFQQLIRFKMGPDEKAAGSEAAYLGGYNGQQPSYYAFPKFCHDVAGLGATMIIMAEYDTLRDSALEYGQRLLRAGVPCELFVAPRVGHCFTAAPHPYTDLVHDMMAWSFRREFGMLDGLVKETTAAPEADYA